MITPVPVPQFPSPAVQPPCETLVDVPPIPAELDELPLQFPMSPAHATTGNTPVVKSPVTAMNPRTPCLSRILGIPNTLWPDEFTLPCSQTLLEPLPRVFVSSDAATHTPSASFHMLR